VEKDLKNLRPETWTTAMKVQGNFPHFEPCRAPWRSQNSGFWRCAGQ